MPRTTPPRPLLMPLSAMIAVLAVLCAVLAPTPVAQAQGGPRGTVPGAFLDTGSTGAPEPELVAKGLLPTPSPDPWYGVPDPDESIAPGSILDVRPVVIPTANIWIPHQAWQLRVRSTDAVGRPMSIISTVIVPLVPVPGDGPRPLVSADKPIDALGLKCNPSWTLLHEPSFSPISENNDMLARGWALVITDHQGPKMAYAAGPLAGHAVLDGVRAAKAFEPADLADSPVVLNGYSGGAIASGWAGQLQPTYAPELGDALVGVVAGGTPSDPDLLFDTMDGQIGSGLFRAAIIGISRAYDELHPYFNYYGVALAAGPMRDMCADPASFTGIAQVPIGWLAINRDIRHDPVVRRVIAANRMGASAPHAPVLLFHGSRSVGIGDQFIPEHGVLRLRDEWCAQGAHVEYLPVFGEHAVAPLTARVPTYQWMADRFAGVPLAPGCVGAHPL